MSHKIDIYVTVMDWVNLIIAFNVKVHELYVYYTTIFIILNKQY